MMNNSIECCANCQYLISSPKNNKYGDIEHFCAFNGYFCHGVYRDRNLVKHFTPGGKELECGYIRRD